VIKVKHVALGREHLMALCADYDGSERVYVAGSNKWGQLGIDPAADPDLADDVLGGAQSKAFVGQMRPLTLEVLRGREHRVLAVACGEAHSLVLVEYTSNKVTKN